MTGNHNDKVLTPFGYRHAADIHLVGDDDDILFEPDRNDLVDLATNEHFDVGQAAPSAAPSFGIGWITYADWYNHSGSTVTSFRTTWVVPDSPTTKDHDQTIYLFNGIQNYQFEPVGVPPKSFILQPVLQWSTSEDNGDAHWSIACWYATGPVAVCKSGPIPVKPGETLIGVIEKIGETVFDGTPLFSYRC